MWHKQSFTQFWSQSDAYSRRSSLKLTYIHHPLVVCTHQICCAVAVPIALSQDRLLHGHNRLVNWTPRSRMREQAKKLSRIVLLENIEYINISHYKCWKLASVTILPIWHFLWSTPTNPLKHADNGSRSDLIDRSLTVLYKLYFTKV